jgi:hypothetical protein
MSHKMLIFKAGIDFFSDPPTTSPRESIINSTTELILTRNQCCGIDAWGPEKFKNLISGRGRACISLFSYLAGMSPYISLKIKKRHFEHHMIEAHKYLITWISDDIFFLKIVGSAVIIWCNVIASLTGLSLTGNSWMLRPLFGRPLG